MKSFFLLGLLATTCVAQNGFDRIIKRGDLRKKDDFTLLSSHNDGEGRGNIQDSNRRNILKWEAGVQSAFSDGCSSSQLQDSGLFVGPNSTCYASYLSSPTFGSSDSVIHQKSQTVTWPVTENNEKWGYTWDSWTRNGLWGSDVAGESGFFIWQLLSRNGGTTFALRVWKGKVYVANFGFVGTIQKNKGARIRDFSGQVVEHQLTIKYGKYGQITYKATNSKSGEVLIEFKASGEIGTRASLKNGPVRKVSKTNTPPPAALHLISNFIYHRL